MRASLKVFALVMVGLLACGLAGAADGLTGRAASAAAVPMKIVLVGDSIMAGTPGDAEALGDLLDQAGVAHQTTNLAVGGLTCADWAAPGALNTAVGLHADLYLVNCGTNDAKFANTLAAMDASLHTIFVTLLNGTPGAHVLPHYIQYNAGWTGRQTSEGPANDAVYRQTTGAVPAGLITPAVGLGFIPETTLADGGHPGRAGYVLTANFQYRSLRALWHTDWPDIAPIPCGMDGHRIGDPPYPQGTYLPYNAPGGCWAGWAVA